MFQFGVTETFRVHLMSFIRCISVRSHNLLKNTPADEARAQTPFVVGRLSCFGLVCMCSHHSKQTLDFRTPSDELVVSPKLLPFA